MADTKTSALPVASSVGANDLIPIVSGGTNYAARASAVAALASGGSGGGSTSISGTPAIRVTDTAYGAKGDGVILTDLSVTAGSKAISSVSAPFTDTATDAGKIVMWLTGATTEVGTIATVQSTTSATLVNNTVAGSVAFGGPNTNGAIGTDNTAAFNAAFAAATARVNTANVNRRGVVPTISVQIPAGVFCINPSGLTTFQIPGVTVQGAGMFATVIAATAPNTVAASAQPAMFTHSTFNSSPQDAYQGTAYQWTYRDIHFIDPCRRSQGTEGQRTMIGIRDNGCGNIRINNCRFTGLAYGFAGTGGSDFSDIRDTFFDQCDVGSYFGPGSQQVNIDKTDYSLCKEGAVFEGAPHWHLGNGSSFEDPTLGAIVLDAQSSGTSKTRFGLNANVGGAFYNGTFLIDGGVWFETNSGGNGRLCPRMIYVKGDGPMGPAFEGLMVRDAYMISGGSQVSGGTNTFLEIATAAVSTQPFIIENLYCSDPSYINSIVRNTGTASDCKGKLIDVRKPPTVVNTQGSASSMKVINRDGTFHGFSSY